MSFRVVCMSFEVVTGRLLVVAGRLLVVAMSPPGHPLTPSITAFNLLIPENFPHNNQ